MDSQPIFTSQFSLKERSLPLFFCERHPRYHLNMVCTSENCTNSGLICAKCIEESHPHSNQYLTCLDDVISTCQKMAHPILTAQNTCPSHVVDTSKDSAFHRLDIVSNQTIQVLRDFSKRIALLASSLELNLKDHLLELRRSGLNQLSEIGEFLSFIHSVQSPIHFSQIPTPSYKNTQQSQIPQNLNCSANPFQGNKQSPNHFVVASAVKNQNKQQQWFCDTVRNIASRLKTDPKLNEIKSLKKYIDECEVGLNEYYQNLRAETNRMIEETTMIISHFAFRSSTSSFPSNSQILSLNSLPLDTIHSDIQLEVDYQSMVTRSIYKGAPLKWIDLLDQLKDIPISSSLLVTLSSSPTNKIYPALSKCLRTTVYNFLSSETLMSYFTYHSSNEIKLLEISELDQETTYSPQSMISIEEEAESTIMISTVDSMEVPSEMMSTRIRFQSVSHFCLESSQISEENEMGKSTITEVINLSKSNNARVNFTCLNQSNKFLQNHDDLESSLQSN